MSARSSSSASAWSVQPRFSTRLSRLGLAVLASAALGACANLAPSYQRPVADLPPAWPVASAPAASAATDAQPPGWRTLVQEPRLRDTIALALDHNRSLRLAVLAIAQARASYGIQAAAQWPTVHASAGSTATRTPAPASSSGQNMLSRSITVGLGVSAYELDLFGRVRNLQDAALDNYLATEDAARSTRVALVAEVANAWLALAADQAQLALSRETLASQQRTLQLGQQRHALGADSALTLAQAQTGAEAARRDVAAAEAQVQQDLNALQLLVGAPLPPALQPAPLGEGALAVLLEVPAGLPSSLLQQRPDVLAAEHALKAAHADIGAARAALYPSISLTGSAGTASRSLGDLFKGVACSFAPSVSLPIFDGGAGQAAVRVAEVDREIKLETYQQTLQTAFREVADALAVRATLAERLAAQQALVAAAQRSHELASARWRGGAASYLDVLDAQRTMYAAQQALIALRQADQANRLSLFKALGGGWQADEQASADAAMPAAPGTSSMGS